MGGRAGETGDPREDPPTNSIVQHDSHFRKSGVNRPGIEPGRALVEGEQSNHYTTYDIAFVFPCGPLQDEIWRDDVAGLRHLPRQVAEANWFQERCTVSERLREEACICARALLAFRVQYPAGSPDFCLWGLCRTMPLVGEFSQGSPIAPALSFLRRSLLTSITLIGSQDLAVKSLQNLFTHLLQLLKTKDLGISPQLQSVCGKLGGGEGGACPTTTKYWEGGDMSPYPYPTGKGAHLIYSLWEQPVGTRDRTRTRAANVIDHVVPVTVNPARSLNAVRVTQATPFFSRVNVAPGSPRKLSSAEISLSIGVLNRCVVIPRRQCKESGKNGQRRRKDTNLHGVVSIFLCWSWRSYPGSSRCAGTTKRMTLGHSLDKYAETKWRGCSFDLGVSIRRLAVQGSGNGPCVRLAVKGTLLASVEGKWGRVHVPGAPSPLRGLTLDCFSPNTVISNCSLLIMFRLEKFDAQAFVICRCDVTKATGTLREMCGSASIYFRLETQTHAFAFYRRRISLSPGRKPVGRLEITQPVHSSLRSSYMTPSRPFTPQPPHVPSPHYLQSSSVVFTDVPVTALSPKASVKTAGYPAVVCIYRVVGHRPEISLNAALRPRSQLSEYSCATSTLVNFSCRGEEERVDASQVSPLSIILQLARVATRLRADLSGQGRVESLPPPQSPNRRTTHHGSSRPDVRYSIPTSVQFMSRQSQCSRVLQAPSLTVCFTRRFHTLSSIHATNTSLAVVPQSPVVVHTSLRSRTLSQMASVKDCRPLGCGSINSVLGRHLNLPELA
ncbi:hypothetical protein PR048_002600 [Dryococelus australis]|uniref:Uncharacterized protein n=1 Tax=Dryococelus australis TaxID=614101 RepID=A0ABQ9IKR3_9NEOP|nr:hypothetical protein PR048_002600 [Dryococelus australis]